MGRAGARGCIWAAVDVTRRRREGMLETVVLVSLIGIAETAQTRCGKELKASCTARDRGQRDATRSRLAGSE